MLKLKIKPSYELGQKEIRFYDLFVSQDLSFISGRTSSQNNMFNGESIKIVNNKNNFIDSFNVEAENVTVMGIVYYTKELEVKSIKRVFNIPDGYDMETVTMENTYVEYKGDICFYSDSLKGYFIEHSFYPASKDEKTIKIETFEYIEGDYINIDGEDYYVDFSDKETPLKEFPYEINNVVLYDIKNWKKETKFIARKKESTHFDVDEVLYGGYENYVTYKGDRYNLSYLYEEDYDGNLQNIGYGVKLDDVIYKDDDINLNFVDEYIFKIHKDIDISSSNIQLSDDEYLIIDSNMCSYSNGGNFIFLVSKSEKLDIHEGNYIVAESTSPIKAVYYTRTDDAYNVSKDGLVTCKDGGSVVFKASGHEYVLYNGDKYDVEPNLYDYVTISGVDYRLIYDNEEKSKAHAFVNGDTMYFTIDSYEISYDGEITCENGGSLTFFADAKQMTVARPTNKIYYVDGDTIDVKYGRIEGYEIHYNDGVKIGNEYYRVYEDINEDGEIISRYITVYDYLKYDLYVDGKEGSSTYICTPYIDYRELKDDFEIDAEQRVICGYIVENFNDFSFSVRNDIFGDIKGFPENLLYDSVHEAKPVNFFGLLNLSMFKINSYINAKIPFLNDIGNNIMKEDIVNSKLMDDINNGSYNTIVDMEKDVYYPVFFDGVNYNPINEIRFNMHFRTRQLDNWKVIEDYVEISDVEKTSDYSNWFVCDYTYYKNLLREGASLQNVSDLVGYMNFSINEVRNMAKKISKSFLRLSFYSTNDPNTQVLLGTSTIFLDEALLARKAFTYTSSAGKRYVNTQSYQKYVLTGDKSLYEVDYCSVDGEIAYDASFNDDFRLSSRITVKDKHNTETSSEGFYFYMFREFSNNLRPSRVYLKIDFNHAGIGKSIPLIIPRKNISKSNPIGEPLYIHKEDDLEKMKDGFTFKDIYKQLYIPIDVIYDDKNNRYVYYLPDELRENDELGVDDSILEFNLFELKFKDESIKDES